MRILGIDSSLTGTGLARLDLLPWPPSEPFRKDGEPVKYELALATVGASKAKPTDTWLARSRRVHEVLNGIEHAITDHVDLVSLEELAFGAKGTALVVLHWLWGEVINICRVESVPLLLVNPSAVKRFATGAGNAKKDVVMLAMANRYPDAGIADNNQADALACAMVGARFKDMPVDTMPQSHLSAMGKVALQ